MLAYECKAYQFKQISETLKDIMAECWFEFDLETITMRNVDPEKVVSVHLFLKPPSTEYRCTEKFVFSFYIQTLYRIFRGVRPTDTVAFVQIDYASLRITIMTESGNVKNEVVMKQLNLCDARNFLVVPHRYPVEVDMEYSQFYGILRDLSSLSRKVDIKIDGGEITFSAEDDYGTVSMFRQSFNNLNYSTRQSYIAKYLEKFSKSGFCDRIVMKIGTGMPLTLLYNLAHGFLTMSISQSV